MVANTPVFPTASKVRSESHDAVGGWMEGPLDRRGEAGRRTCGGVGRLCIAGRKQPSGEVN